MKDYMNIGSVPAGEDCQQVGTPQYDHTKARAELNAFRNQLRRTFGDEPGSARIAIKGFPHDFGTYHEIVVNYDDQDEEAIDYAFKLQAEMPESWDEEAKKELALVS